MIIHSFVPDLDWTESIERANQGLVHLGSPQLELEVEFEIGLQRRGRLDSFLDRQYRSRDADSADVLVFEQECFDSLESSTVTFTSAADLIVPSNWRLTYTAFLGTIETNQDVYSSPEVFETRWVGSYRQSAIGFSIALPPDVAGNQVDYDTVNLNAFSMDCFKWFNYLDSNWKTPAAVLDSYRFDATYEHPETAYATGFGVANLATLDRAVTSWRTDSVIKYPGALGSYGVTTARLLDSYAVPRRFNVEGFVYLELVFPDIELDPPAPIQSPDAPDYVLASQLDGVSGAFFRLQESV